MTYEEFKQVYLDAWKGGAKGATTFRASGKRYGILNTVKETVEEETPGTSETEITPEENGTEATACFFDPLTGQRECS